MHYSEGRHYTNERYGNTTQPMTPRVIVMPSIETAQRTLTACYVNLTLGVNTEIYLSKIAAILAAFPELKRDTPCK